MGELKENIYIIGSPDVDILLSKTLPSLQSVKKNIKLVTINMQYLFFILSLPN